MASYAINHITARQLTIPELFELAASLGMVGVELRNDLEAHATLWSMDPSDVAALSKRYGVAVITVAQVNDVDRWDAQRQDETERLADWAAAAGASAIMLCPTLNGSITTEPSRTAALREALVGIEPILTSRGLIGSVEPNGSPGSGITAHTDVVRALEGMFDGAHPFRIAYDTAQWFRATDRTVAPDLVAIVQASGINGADHGDDQRVLPGEDDVTDAAGQIAALTRAGVTTPVSFECLSPTLTTDPALYDDLAAAIRYLDAPPPATMPQR